MFGISLRLRLTKVPTSGAARQYRSISSGWPYRLDMSRFVFFLRNTGAHPNAALTALEMPRV